MGLFSSIGKLFGGGGGSSVSSSQNTTIENTVEIDFDVDKLAETLKNNTLLDIFFKSELAVKELTVKEKEQKIKEDALKVSAISLQQQIKTDKNVMILTIVGIFLAFIGLIYNKKRKGKR